MKSGNEQKEFNIKDLIHLMKKEGISSLTWVKTDVFMISSEQFLAFAKKDISEKNLRGKINALCNAKRAIESRVDNLIYNYNLNYYAKKNQWTFPIKIEKLSEIDIKIPKVLQNQITSKRNLLEHEYVIPKNRREVEDIIDIADLFLVASREYMKMGNLALRIVNEPPNDEFLSFGNISHMEVSHMEVINRNPGISYGMIDPSFLRDKNKKDNYAIFFDSEENSIKIYKENWKRELKMDKKDENDMITLIKFIRNSSPAMQRVYEKVKLENYPERL